MQTSSRRTLKAALALAVLAAAAGTANAQQTVYAIANGGSSLIRFPSNNPSAITVVGNFAGANVFLDAIDFRPATGELFGYLDSADAYYTVNLNTAALTLNSAVAGAGATTNTFQLGMDWNPTIDRLRVITDSTQNIVYNPNTGTAAAFTNLFYGPGDPNEQNNALIIDNAYTQSFNGSTSTQQYAIDYGLDVLVTVANNAGTLGTVGPLGVDTDTLTGFDVFTNGAGIDTAYAIFTPLNGTPSFYTINLGTGAASLVGAVGAPGLQLGNVYSLAVIPAPGIVSALASGLFLFGARRRR